MGDPMSEKHCDWQSIDGFGSDREYEQFLLWITEQVEAGIATEVRVRKKYSGVDWDEHWYRCIATKEVWRLVAPDPPFNGIFEPV